jgi:hypothetical protein
MVFVNQHIMRTGTLEKKIAQLPEGLRVKAESIIDVLLTEAKTNAKHDTELKPKENRGYGSLKGKIWISDDFDEPLDDLKGYM